MKSKGYICVILSAVFFALGGLLIKMNTWSALTINGMRCIFAFAAMAIYMKLQGHKLIINRTVIFCAVVNTGMSLTYVMANKLTTAANTIVLQFTLPIFIILISWAVWHIVPKKVEVLACIFAFAGIICFFLDKLSFDGMVGNILAIFSGFMYALVFLNKKMKGADFQSSTLISFLLSFVICIPALFTEEYIVGPNLWNIAAMGLIQMAAAYICLDKGLDLVPPVPASLLSMIEPILNPILVAIFYGEMIGPLSMVGAVIVLGTACVYNVYQAKQAST